MPTTDHDYIMLLFALNVLQGLLVLGCFAAFWWGLKRLYIVESILKEIPNKVIEHDNLLLERFGKEVYSQMSNLMHDRAEERALAWPNRVRGNDNDW